MNKKICIAIFVCILLTGILTMRMTFAKYVIEDKKQMSVYIDKTPPIINVTSGEKQESFPKTQTEVIKKTDNVMLDTSDNIQIDHNEIYYNPTDNNFDGKTPENFDNEKELTNEGYYKVVAEDTSGNQTEIIILIDKSAPEVTVQFYKKNQVGILEKNGGVSLCA